MNEPAVPPLAERVDPTTTALVVVDVQNDFCHSDSPFAKMGRDMSAAQEIVPRLMLLVDAARAAGATVIWVKMVRNEHTMSEVERDHRARTRPGAPIICQEGSWGAELYRVEPAEGEPIVQKHRYSAFVDTELPLILRTHGIRTLVMTGVATNVCVESTARDAYMRDYHVVFVDDCTAARDAERHAAALSNIADQFGLVVKAADLFEAWQRVPSAVS